MHLEKADFMAGAVLCEPRSADFSAGEALCAVSSLSHSHSQCKNARGTTTRVQSLEAPAADTQIQRACAVEMNVENFERTVNSSELAVHGRALQRSKHQLLFHYSKNLSIIISGRVARATSTRRLGLGRDCRKTAVRSMQTSARGRGG